MKRLTEKETPIMEMLWEHGPMFAREIVDLFPDPKPHFNTVSTFLRILESKGYLTHEKMGNSFRYVPVVGPETLKDAAVSALVDDYFAGSVKELINFLIGNSSLSDDDVWDLMDELRRTRKR